jgi:K(+)-stimulated pyrophosphate-energized sodium pump
VELAVSLSVERGTGFTSALAAVFFIISMVFVLRSFYGMRIRSEGGVIPAAAKH